MKNKKGLEAKVLIGIIITIIVALVILRFISYFNATGTIDKETCHTSVLLRSMPSVIGDAAKAGVPLKCKTEPIQINSNNAVEIEGKLANAMYDCWWMLGEGKLDFFTESTWQKLLVNPASKACVICSRITFGDKTKKEIPSVDITSYLQDVQIPSKSVTYLEYFSEEKGAKLQPGIEVAKIDTSKEYTVIYMGLKGGSIEEILQTDGGLALGGAFIASNIPGMGSLVKLIAEPVAIASLGLIAAQGFMTSQREWVAGMRCGDVKGCNMVILTEYSPEELGKACDNIESIP
ncbi:MAG: hypothetical protein V1660_01550 [archaeon]